MRRAARTDNNQADIVRELRRVGATVTCLHAVGKGCPDLLVGFCGRNYLMEVKSPYGNLEATQREWIRDWRGQVAVVRNGSEAISVIVDKEV